MSAGALDDELEEHELEDDDNDDDDDDEEEELDGRGVGVVWTSTDVVKGDAPNPRTLPDLTRYTPWHEGVGNCAAIKLGGAITY